MTRRTHKGENHRMSIDLDRITHPLRLARGSHEPGSGKGCAMNVISYINGDIQITDFPECSARPLAKLVQQLNDGLADKDGYLSPENGVLVLDLGWRTVGTAGVPREVVLRWLAELLIDPVYGVVQHAGPAAVPAIRRVAELLGRQVAGGLVSVAEWTQARKDANANAAYAEADATFAAYSAAVGAGAVAYAAMAGADGVNAATYLGKASAYAAESVGPLPDFVAWAIDRWRHLAGLVDPQPITADDVNNALEQIGHA